jgi:hypothetical protein
LRILVCGLRLKNNPFNPHPKIDLLSIWILGLFRIWCLGFGV